MRCCTTYMRPLVLILILSYTESLSCMNCIPKRRPTIYCMKDFVNTKERLWTYKISRSGRIRCQNNLMRFITPEHIVYNRTFVYNGGRESIVLQGQFSARHKNWMDVSTTDLEPRFLCRETLIFMANNTSCGVVKLEPVRNGDASKRSASKTLMFQLSLTDDVEGTSVVLVALEYLLTAQTVKI
uniref:Putative lipocalin n=1 Tax=Rhipicephalus microplus TaxID=6941 RepID=A0A6G5A2D2_RHIMP